MLAGLLTDNWYSGYRGEGAMEVGLTYLAGENPGLLVSFCNAVPHTSKQNVNE